MQIVIDIPEDEYELVRHENKSYRTELVLMNAVAEGTPLSKGRWLSTILGGYECSNCNKEFPYPRFIGRALYYYCPNCGAKMEVEK